MDVNLTTGERQKLEEGKTISFTYSVKWKASDVNFGDRFDKYLDPTFFQHRVRKTKPGPRKLRVRSAVRVHAGT